MEKSINRIAFLNSDALVNVKLDPSVSEIAGETIIMAAFNNNDHKENITETIPLCYTTAVDANSEKMAMLNMVNEFEKLEITFSNAGIDVTYTGKYDMEAAMNDREIALNITGQFYSMKYELQQFLKQAGSNV